MSDQQIANALCGYIVEHYPTYANRYTSELAEVSADLDSPANQTTTTSPKADNAATRDENYWTAVKLMELKDDQIVFDMDGYKRFLEKGGTASGIPSTQLVNGQSCDDITETQLELLEAVNSTPSPGGGLCLRWVCNVFSKIGINQRLYSAYKDDYLATETHADTAITVGAVVCRMGSSPQGYGHIGIYVGDGLVADSRGAFDDTGNVVISDFETWVSWQTDTINGKRGYFGWGWFGNVPLT